MRKGKTGGNLYHEGTGIRGKENSKEKSGVLCDSQRCDGRDRGYQPKCMFHPFRACSPRTASGTYYKERGIALTRSWGNGSHQNTTLPSLHLFKPSCFLSLCLWRKDSPSLSTLPPLDQFPPWCWEFAPSAPCHSVWHYRSFFHQWLLSSMFQHSNLFKRHPLKPLFLYSTHSLSLLKASSLDVKHLSASSFPLL